MGAGITIPLALEAEKLAMKAELGTALVTFWDSMQKPVGSTMTTTQQYGDEFADVLVEKIFSRMITYIVANANITALGGVIPPAPVNPTTITVTPVITLL